MTLRRATTILLCIAAAVAVSACGSDDEGKQIPQDSAAALASQLDNIQARLANGSVGACNDIVGGDNDPNTDAVSAQIDSLPDDVDGDVVKALRDGFDRLFQLVDDHCSSLEEDKQQTDTETTPPIPTVTETVPETTTEPPATTPTTPTQTETTPQDNGVIPNQGNGGQGNNGGGGGNGNSGGSGGGAFQAPED